MLQFQVVTELGIDGIVARIPSIAECEAWGANEDDAIAALLEMVGWFLNLPHRFRHTLDMSRREENTKFYTLIIRH